MVENIKKNFTNYVTVTKQAYTFKGIPNPFWVSGFTSGNSSFSFFIEFNKKINQTRLDYYYDISLVYSINLNIWDFEVLKGLFQYFYDISDNSNTIFENSYKVEKNNLVQLQISNFNKLITKIIPFFDYFPLLGVKVLYFKDFKKVAKIIENTEHLTSSDISNIFKIKSNMNQKRRI